MKEKTRSKNFRNISIGYQSMNGRYISIGPPKSHFSLSLYLTKHGKNRKSTVVSTNMATYKFILRYIFTINAIQCCFKLECSAMLNSKLPLTCWQVVYNIFVLWNHTGTTIFVPLCNSITHQFATP